ncbi:MAG: hypothetical protein CMM50_16010 [Rhodospirillaceae bacterium]|nr:hypothetical protein [Rhodospirillaceae bacterium]
MIVMMTLAAGTGLLMQVGAGCFSPTIVSNDSEAVSLKYGPYETFTEVQGKAKTMCAVHDKTAALIMEEEIEDGFRVAHFACVAEAAG